MQVARIHVQLDEKHVSRNLRERGRRRCRTNSSSSVACTTREGTPAEVGQGGRGGRGHRVPFCPRGPRFTGSVLLASHLHLAKSGLTTDLLFLSVLFLFLFSSTTSVLPRGCALFSTSYISQVLSSFKTR